jgi:hypothetical protein
MDRWLCLLGLATLLLVAGCEERAARTKVSDDMIVQAKYETALRTLDEIRAGVKKGRNIYADCKTAEMLFFKDLKRLEVPAAQQVVTDLQAACTGAKPL